MAGGADIRAGRAFVEIILKNSLTRGLGQAKKQLESFGKSATSAGKTLLGIGVGAAVPIAFLTKTYMDFDDAMRAVGAVSQSTDAELASLTKTAKDLGASTSFTAIQVANLMGELGRAGFSAAQIEDMTGAVLNLSRATGTDATLSAGIMAASIRQFGLAATDATRVADALTMAANASFNSVESLGEALSYAGPVAADFNMSIEDTLAVLGALGNVGIQGSNAGTAVRRLLTLGGAEAEKLQGIFGVAFKDAAGNARPLVDVLDEVNKATAGLGTADRAKKFNEAFGLLGITGASAIAKNAVSVKELQKKIKEADGTAAKTAKTMDSGLGGAFRIMMSAIEGVQIAIGEALAPVLTDVAKRVEKFSTAVIKLVNENKMLAVGALGVVAGIAAAGVALIGLGFVANGAAAGIGLVLAGMTAVATVGGLLLSPLGLITAALTSGVVAWALWTDSGQSAMSILASVFENVSAAFRQTWGGIVDALKGGDLALAGKIAVTGLQLAFAVGLQSLSQMIGGTLGMVISNIGGKLLRGDLQGAWDSTVLSMASVWDGFINGIVQAFKQAVDVISAMWNVMASGLQGSANKIADFLAERGGAAGGAAAAALRLSAQGLSVGAANVSTTVTDTAAAMAEAARQRAARSGGAAINDAAQGVGASNDEVRRLQAELEELTNRAGIGLYDDEKANAAGEVDAARNGGIAAMKGGGGSFGSFSAAGLLAGVRGGMAEKQLAAMKEQVKLLKEQVKLQKDEMADKNGNTIQLVGGD